MQKFDPLIHTKLRPPFPRSGLVSRSRLQEQIVRGLRGPLTLVTAPAGFGKTTLVASGVNSTGMPIAWVSLDKNDNQAGRFLSYLIAAVQGADKEIGSEAAQLMAATPPPSHEAVLSSLINDLDSKTQELGVVLDDYQFINSQAVHEAVTFLLEHCPKSLHLVIATRSDPPLPLSRLRARAQLVELRAADLRFTEAEAAQFLNNVMGLQLEAKPVATLEECTEGWIAGLQMAALSMRERKDVSRFIEKFSGTNRYIMDYLLEEVLANQPPEIQNFLLFTSILERLAAPLCEAVLTVETLEGWVIDKLTAGFPPADRLACQPILEYLERANLFLLPLDDEQRWYRYHHLFADLLRTRLDQIYPGLARQLHACAAGWLEREGMAVEAVNHSLAAGDYDRAAQLVEQNTARLLDQGELNSLTDWIETLPVELRSSRPWLCVHQAYALMFAGRTGEVESLLAQAEAPLKVDPHQDESMFPDETDKKSDVQARTGAIATIRAFAAAVSGKQVEALSRALQAKAMLATEDLFNRSLVAWTLGYVHHIQGHLSEARSAYEEQIWLAKTMRNDAVLMIGLTALSRLLKEQGDLHQARALMEGALAEASQKGAPHFGYLARMETHLASLLYEQNELVAARHLLLDALDHSRSWVNPNHLVTIDLYLAEVSIAQGDFQGADRLIREVHQIRRTNPLSTWLGSGAEAELVRMGVYLRSVDPDFLSAQLLNDLITAYMLRCESELVDSSGNLSALPDMMAITDALTLARAEMAGGQTEKALGWLGQITHWARASGCIGVLIYSLVTTAVARQDPSVTTASEMPPAPQALAALEEALRLAEPGAYVRIFLNEGKPIQSLLTHWLEHAGPGTLRDYGLRLLSQFKAESPPVTTAQPVASPAGGSFESSNQALVEPLTPREREVLLLICAGDSNQMIADKLVISLGAAKKHASNILGKLGVASRAQAIVKARQLGLLMIDN